MSTDSRPKLLVLGDIILDHYIHGATTRINPEAPVPVVDVSREERRLGGAANVARNLLALDADVSLLAVVGSDEAGVQLRQELESHDVQCEGVVVVPGRPTTVKNRIVVSNQQIARLDWETREPIPESAEQALIEHARRMVPAADAVLISDYAKGVVTDRLAQRVIAICREAGVPVLVDPKREIEKYRGATLLKPNAKEAVEMTGLDVAAEPTLQQAGEQLRERLQLEHVLITLGERGFALFGDEPVRAPTRASEVVDVTGAGDTVLATLGWAVASGRSVAEAAHIANRAAGISVSKFGAATVTPAELSAAADRAGEEPRIHSVEELARMTRDLQARGKRVVLTNGCFDVLHVGHVAYLRDSRRCGDVLIVGVNSDASVRRLKGPERPMFQESERSRIVASLSPVDYVFVFDEDTPYEAISAIRPDVLTKGDDYRYEEVVGHDLVNDVRLIPLVQGKSSTTAIQRIRKSA